MTIRIHHLNCGTLCPVCQRLINGFGGWTDAAELVCHCLLIETPKTLVLVDTGFGQQDVAEPERRLGKSVLTTMRPRLDPAETAIAQVKALGFDPRDVQHIVPTHLDLDHAGGLSDFPEAKVHVLQAELDQILKPTRRDRMRFRKVQFDHQPDWAVYDQPQEAWKGFSVIRPIPELDLDLLMVPLIGHTKGHVGVAVHDGNQWQMHCGDAYFHHSEVTATPDVPRGLAVFEKLVRTWPDIHAENQQRLQQLALGHEDVTLFCAHDPLELARYQS
ncbi:MAG: MBL fold metallo-hydrolase [Marinobacter sp.]|nr:MBL fold metallo-hydrolase [Marinobacter sp.]